MPMKPKEMLKYLKKHGFKEVKGEGEEHEILKQAGAKALAFGGIFQNDGRISSEIF